MFGIEKNAVLAGLSAAFGSIFSKLAFEDESKTLQMLLCYLLYQNTCQKVIPIFRIACILSMVLANVCMWMLFTRSLQHYTSTAKATVVNNACNFLFSSVFGWLVFGEVLSLMWWAGFSLILVGFILMSTDGKEDDNASSRQHDKSN